MFGFTKRFLIKERNVYGTGYLGKTKVTFTQPFVNRNSKGNGKVLLPKPFISTEFVSKRNEAYLFTKKQIKETGILKLYEFNENVDYELIKANIFDLLFLERFKY